MSPRKKTDSERRTELLGIAAELFADRGVKQTTVRDIADAANILSGSLYHHFDSKESMVDEILTRFLDELWTRYRAILAAGLPPRDAVEAVVVTSFECIHQHRAEVAIFQNDAAYLGRFERFGYLQERNVEFRQLWLGLLEAGIADGVFRKDLNVELVYRFVRDTVWVAARWYRPGGTLSAHDVAREYLGILLEGIARRD
ncbi:MAG: TetR/AcrR family transcriptional regulator [Micromonosporaceae bacterium]